MILGDSDTVGEEHVTVLHAHPLLKGGKGGGLTGIQCNERGIRKYCTCLFIYALVRVLIRDVVT